MHKLYTALALAAAFIPASVLAHDGQQQRFAYHGTTYTYTVTPASGGRQIIEGRSQPTGSTFRLVVAGDRVDGVSGGQPVSFRTADVKVAAR